MKIKHSIISWDCSYRNFFHLIEGLKSQAHDKNLFETIFIEQRSKQVSDDFNHGYGLKSLGETVEEAKKHLDIRVEYLNDMTSVYHLGKSVNLGMKLAKGDIISVMDGDLLLKSNFMKELDRFHKKNPGGIANLYRYSANFPVGVPNFGDWTKAKINLNACRRASIDLYKPITDLPENYGPMVSANKKLWEKIGYYDEHPIWATSVSRIHFDTNIRLEKASMNQAQFLKHTYSVHPWHPVGVSEKGRNNHEDMVKQALKFQKEIINYSSKNSILKPEERIEFVDTIYNSNQAIFSSIIENETIQKDSQLQLPINKLNDIKKIVRKQQVKNLLKRTKWHH